MEQDLSEADFLRVFGIAREGFDGLRLAKMCEKVSTARAEAAMNFIVDKGMNLKLGTDPKTSLTKDMVLFQMKTYFALLELKREFGLDFMGVQDQLDWIEHYPATDLTLGLLNNRLRPEGDGETLVVSTEADDGAAMTMQILKMLNNGDPAGFNDLRYWDPKQGLYWFVNSGTARAVLRLRLARFAQGLLVGTADPDVLPRRRRHVVGRRAQAGRRHVGAHRLPQQQDVSLRGPRPDRRSDRTAVARALGQVQPRLAALVSGASAVGSRTRSTRTTR